MGSSDSKGLPQGSLSDDADVMPHKQRWLIVKRIQHLLREHHVRGLWIDNASVDRTGNRNGTSEQPGGVDSAMAGTSKQIAGLDPEKALELVGELQQSYGFHSWNSTSSTELLLERTVFELTNLLEHILTQPENATWREEAAAICSELEGYIRPPLVHSIFPLRSQKNLETLNIINVPLDEYPDDVVTDLRQLLQNNPSIWKFECSFTGMRSEQFLRLLPVLTSMPHLTYLGLRGNHLQNSDVAHLQKMLSKSRSNFPKLMWIDLANNLDIVTLPVELCKQLQVRWPIECLSAPYAITPRDVADGNVAVVENDFKINV